MSLIPKQAQGFIFIIILGAFAAYFFFSQAEINQKKNEIDQSNAVNEFLYEAIGDKQNLIADYEIELSQSNNRINSLAAEVENLEREISGRSCESISYEEFDRLVRIGTQYVITPEKMGFGGFWTIRENILFERENELARGYEIRIDMTPELYYDKTQEIHTTIRAFHSNEAAYSFFLSKGKGGEKQKIDDHGISFGIPLELFGPNPSDIDQTTSISFHCGIFQVDIKIKLLNNVELAIQYLEKAASLVFHDLSVWIP